MTRSDPSSSGIWDVLADLCDELSWTDARTGWPAEGLLQGQLRIHKVCVFIRSLGPSGRKRPEERRFQNPAAKSNRPIHPNVSAQNLLLGLWLEEGKDRAVVASFDIERRVQKDTRFSMFVPLATLQRAAESGFSQHKNSRGEVVSAIRVDRLAAFVDQKSEAAVAHTSAPENSPPSPAQVPMYVAEPPMTPGSINIRPRVGMYAAFARLNYRPWFAISEFIDNSIQSYLLNRSLLAESLDVEVTIEEDQILVVDRAGGIPVADFPRAFSPSQPPPDNTGLSEFGLGMKAAACWFAHRWSVRTTAIGDGVERTVSFDVPRITSEGIEQLSIQECSVPAQEHYTVIKLTNLRDRPKGRTVAKIKEHLASIYRVLIGEKIIKLRFTTPSGSEELEWSAPQLLTASHFKTPRGRKVEWRKEFTFEVAPGKRIYGWAGILRRGSTSKAGFSIFRRRRLIEGGADGAYRPKEIFRSPNSFTYQRVTGEIHVEGFNVSHTKDGIQWGGLEETMVHHLRLELDAKPLPLLKQAEGYRYRTRGDEVPKGFGEKAIESAAAVINEDDTTKTLSDQTEVSDNDEPDVVEPIQRTEVTKSVTKRTVVVRMPTDHRPWSVDLELVSDPTKTWYEFGAENQPKEQRMHVLINLAHPFSEHFLNDNEKVMTPLIRLVAGLALAEHTARLGRNKAGSVRTNLNQLLDGPLGTAESKDEHGE